MCINIKGNGRIAVVAFFLLMIWPPFQTSAFAGLENSQGRAMWVVRFALTDSVSVRRIVDDAFINGFKLLLVQVRGRGDAWYASTLEPSARALRAGTFDPLAYLIDYAAFYDIEVHAWVNALLVWSRHGTPRDAQHILNKHPDWMMHDRKGRSLTQYSRTMFDKRLMEGVFVSPALPEVREYTTALITDLLTRYKLDGIHLDYIRYPSPDFDYHPGVINLFQKEYHFDPSRSVTSAEATCWQQWRMEQLTILIFDIYSVCRSFSPDILLSVAVKPNIREARERFGQDWGEWCRQGIVDAVMPMTYTEKAHLFREQMAAVKQVAGEVPVYMGIGAYKQPAFAALQKVWSVLLRGDIYGISVFSYNYAMKKKGYLPAFREGPFKP